MNITIFQRLLWKEFRQQWAFWVAMLFLTTLLLILSEVMFTFLSIRPREYSYHLIYVFCLVMLYALGCGATLFATEHDTGTYQFLRNLPVGSFSVFMSKITLAVFATAALAGILFLPTHLLARYYYKNIEVFPWPVWCLGLGLALAWGSLFSQLVKRPLLAAFLGGTIGCASYLLVVILLEKEYYKNPTLYYPIFFWMLIALCLANAWLGRRWLRSRSLYIGRAAARWGLTDSPLSALDDENMQPPRTSTIVRRLAWQQWRFSWLMMGTIALGLFVFLTLQLGFGPPRTGQSVSYFAAWTMVGNFASVYNYPPEQFAVFHFLLPLSCFTITLFGSVVFLGDQRNHSVKFLAQRAARPWHVWFSRQIVWGAPFLLVGFVSFLLCIVNYVYHMVNVPPHILENANLQQTVWWRLWHFWREIVVRTPEWIGVVGIFFAAGQLCSMLFRSGLLAVVFGLVLSATCAAWVALMIFLGASPIWSVLPIAIGMLWATLLHTPNWMRGHVGWRQYVRPTATVIVPIILILIAIPFHRVYSILGDGPGFDVAKEYSRIQTEAEIATVEMYRKASELMKPNALGTTGVQKTKYDLLNAWNWKVPKGEKEWRDNLEAEATDWIEANNEAIELAMAASRRDSCGLFFSKPSGISTPTTTLAFLLVIDGHRLTGQGKLDLATKRYLAALRIASHLTRGITFRSSEIIERRAYEGLRYWSTAPAQTPARIKAAIEQIDAIAKTRSSCDEIVKQFHMLARSIILDQDSNALSRYTGGWASDQWYSLPWERARLLRMLDLITAGDLEFLKNMGDQVNNNFTYGTYQANPSLLQQEIDYLTFEERNPCDPIQVRSLCGRIAFHESNAKTMRQATKIILALKAWKLEHGQLPKTLGELVGPYFKKLPEPPRAGTVFAYFPKGLPSRLWAFSPQAGNYGPYERAPFAPNLPLLLVCNQQYEETGGQDTWDNQLIPAVYGPRSSDDLLNNGFAFPIPINVP